METKKNALNKYVSVETKSVKKEMKIESE
jgi:hypothetical protein